jgi:hypothetical protein
MAHHAECALPLRIRKNHLRHCIEYEYAHCWKKYVLFPSSYRHRPLIPPPPKPFSLAKPLARDMTHPYSPAKPRPLSRILFFAASPESAAAIRITLPSFRRCRPWPRVKGRCTWCYSVRDPALCAATSPTRFDQALWR